MATAQVAPIRTETTAKDNRERNLLEEFAWLPCRVSLEVPVPRFTVKDLLGLSNGQVIQSSTSAGEDIPLHVNEVSLGRGQFEAVGDRMAVRITEIV